MNKQEFEQRFGKEVTDEFFRQSERMYMACGDNVDKDRFCAGLKQANKNIAALELMLSFTEQVELRNAKIRRIELQAETLDNELCSTTEKLNKTIDNMADLLVERDDLKAENSAACLAMVKAGMNVIAEEIFGRRRVIASNLSLGIALDIEDQRFVIKEFSKRI